LSIRCRKPLSFFGGRTYDFYMNPSKKIAFSINLTVGVVEPTNSHQRVPPPVHQQNTGPGEPSSTSPERKAKVKSVGLTTEKVAKPLSVAAKDVPYRDIKLNQRRALARKQQGRCAILHDPIEDEPGVALILKAAYARAKAEMNPNCSTERIQGLWDRVKIIMKNEHKLAWYSPGEMNPCIRFE